MNNKQQKLTLFPVLLLLIMVLFSFDSHTRGAREEFEEEILQQEERRRVGGQIDELYQKVGLVRVYFNDNAPIECTGILVGSQSVLVESRCLLNPVSPRNSNLMATPEMIEFIAGYLSPFSSSLMPDETRKDSYDVEDIYMAPSYYSVESPSGVSNAGNLAVLKLKGATGHLGHLNLISIEEFKEVEFADLLVIGHAKTYAVDGREGALFMELWEHEISYEREEHEVKGRRQPIITLHTPLITEDRSSIVLARVANEYRVLGMMNKSLEHEDYRPKRVPPILIPVLGKGSAPQDSVMPRCKKVLRDTVLQTPTFGRPRPKTSNFVSINLLNKTQLNIPAWIVYGYNTIAITGFVIGRENRERFVHNLEERHHLDFQMCKVLHPEEACNPPLTDINLFTAEVYQQVSDFIE